MSQALIFELDGVRVTPTIVQVGETSYQLANIGSVRVAHFRKFNRLAILSFLIGGALITASSISNGPLPVAELSLIEWGATATLLAVALQLTWPKWTLSLMLNMSNREVRVLTSSKSKFVFNVKHAIEGAFIIRSHRPSLPD